MPRAPLLPPLRLTGPLWLYLGWLLMGTLYPFEFEPGPILPRLPEFAQRLQHGPAVFFTKDFISNVFLFVPFGLIVTLHFPVRFRRRLWPVLATATLACLLSSLIEFAQLFVHNRHSSVTDVISNTLGGLIGSLTIRFWPRSYGRHLASLIPRKAAWSALLAISLLLACVPAAIPILFDDWHLPGLWATDVTLNAGNNPSLTQPWYGRLHRVAIYARALGPVEVRECFQTIGQEVPSSRHWDKSLLAFYDFNESESKALLDRTGKGADLNLEGPGRFRWRPRYSGLQLRHPARLSTGSLAGKRLSSSLLETREFSVEAWITPRNLIQRGPALILTLAGLGDNSNLLLGQSSSDLVFWVRTPVSGPSQTALSVATTSQPLKRRLTHVVAVFLEGRLELFVNGVLSGTLDLRRDGMIGLPAKRTNGARVAYAFVYFFPCTLFWSSLLARKRYVVGPWVGAVTALTLLLVGEILQAASAKRGFDAAFSVIGFVVILVAAVVARLSSPAPRTE